MIEYLAAVATIAAIASVVRCWLAWVDRRDRLVLLDRGNYIRIIDRVGKHG